jgi:hypothetical protein
MQIFYRTFCSKPSLGKASLKTLLSIFDASKYSQCYTGLPFTEVVFEGETSDWSSTQTITIDANAAEPSQNTTSTTGESGNQATSETGLYGIAIAALVVITVIALIVSGTVLVRRKTAK